MHCILPCRAFNTSAIFIHKDYKSDNRFSGLENIINGDVILNNDNINIDRNLIKNIHNFVSYNPLFYQFHHLIMYLIYYSYDNY